MPLNSYEIYVGDPGYPVEYMGMLRARSASEAKRLGFERWGYRAKRGHHPRAKIRVKRIGNPTKAQKRLNASKRSKQKRVAVALKKYLQQQNPGMKLAGAKVQRLKGGAVKITPIKSIRGRK